MGGKRVGGGGRNMRCMYRHIGVPRPPPAAFSVCGSWPPSLWSNSLGALQKKGTTNEKDYTGESLLFCLSFLVPAKLGDAAVMCERGVFVKVVQWRG